MKNNPLVSIIINNYNYGRFLREAIDSALNQTYCYREVIVVDDGSTDDSNEIIESYRNRIISVIKENGGQASAFNAGFAVSQGDIICFLDSDDIFLPKKVAEVVDVFKSQPEINWCFHRLSFFDNDTGKIIPKNNYSILPQNCDFRRDTERGKLPFIPTATSGICFRRSLLQLVLPMPEDIRITSDNYIKFTTLGLSIGCFLNKELVIQRVHGDNAYTLRKDKQQFKAIILILTAYWIRIKFPKLFRLANEICVNSLVIYWNTSGLNSEATDLVNKYFSSVTLWERFKIKSKTLYRYLKALKT